MKLSELTYQQLFNNEKVFDFTFDCHADDSISYVGRDRYEGHHECEERFKQTCQRIIDKYGDVEISVHYPTDLNRYRPTGAIRILDENYLADKQAYIKAKGEALARWGYTD